MPHAPSGARGQGWKSSTRAPIQRLLAHESRVPQQRPGCTPVRGVNQSGPPNRRPIPGGAGSAGAPRNPERAGAQSRLRTPSHTGAREQWPPISIPPRGRHVPPHVEKAAAAIQTSERSSLGVLTPPELVTPLRWPPLGTTRSTGRRSTTPHAATTAAANSVPEVLRVKFQGAPPALRLHPRRPSADPPHQV